jgi:chromosome segregation ATPase
MDTDTHSHAPEILFERFNRQLDVITGAGEQLRAHREELARLQFELREMYQKGRSPDGAELEELRQENELLRKLLEESAERQVAETKERLKTFQTGKEEAAAEIAILRRQLQEQDALIEELHKPCQETGDPSPNDTMITAYETELADLRHQLQEQITLIEELRQQCQEMADLSPEGRDAADYEAELNEFRRQIESDRQTLNEEIKQLRARNAELNDAAREAELELSRERAQLARERVQLDRMREEIRQALERAQREAGVRELLAPLQRLKDEMAVRHRPPPQPNQTPAPR